MQAAASALHVASSAQQFVVTQSLQGSPAMRMPVQSGAPLLLLLLLVEDVLEVEDELELALPEDELLELVVAAPPTPTADSVLLQPMKAMAPTLAATAKYGIILRMYVLLVFRSRTPCFLGSKSTAAMASL